MESEFANETQERTPLNYPDPPSPNTLRACRFAIELLLPPPIKPADLVALFDGRATYSAADSWRRGRFHPPAWALEILDRKLVETCIEPIEQHRRHLKPRYFPRGAIGTMALRRYRAQKAKGT